MNKLTQTLITASLLLCPLQSFAAVDSLETVAGLATEVSVSDLPANSPVALTIQTPDGDTLTMSLSSDANGQATTWVAGNDLQTAGTYSVEVTARSVVQNGSFVVHPDTLDPYISFIDAERTSVDVGEEIMVTIVLSDRFGNPLPGRSAELISSRGDDVVQALTRETDTYGEQGFMVRASQNGDISLRAIDLISGQTLQDELHVLAGSVARSVGGPEYVAYSAPSTQFYKANPYAANVLSNGSALRAQALDREPPRFNGININIIGVDTETEIIDGKEEVVFKLKQNEPASMLLTAQDQNENTFYDFVGMVELATTDQQATLPLFGEYNFRFEDEGRKKLTLGLEFVSSGRQLMVIYDPKEGIPSDHRQALGYAYVDVEEEQIIKPPSKPIIIGNPRANSVLNATEVTVEGNGPAFINITVDGGTESVTGETDRQGYFSVPVTLDSSKTEHTLMVYDTDAPDNKTELSFTIDITAPAIDTITFTPENPVEGTDVLVVVDTEPGSQDVTLTIGEETVDLMTTDPGSGKFQKLLTTPEAGTYDVTISASDTYGNIGQKTAQLPVALRGLPSVQNIIAEAQINAIALRWDPITDDEIDAYRIYVGTSPDEFLYTLDTDRPTAAATVAGLRPGTTYYFAVTALQGPRESEEKGEIVSATVLGVKLDVTPGDGSVFIEWTSLQQEKTISNFLLQYTVDGEDGSQTEPVELLLNGDLRAYTVRDLINGLTYNFTLIPITTTGEKLTDLAADGQGTPIGRAFTTGVSDPVPFDLRASAPPTPRPPQQAPLSEQGLPAWMLVSILGGSVVLYQMHLRRQKNKQATMAFLQTMESRYHQ